MRNERQEMIVEIITRKTIGTQAELAHELEREGIHACQATLSRDISALRLTRERTAKGRYRYILPRERAVDVEARLRTIFSQCVTGIDRAQNLVVIKTLPGLASAACASIDKMSIRTLVGTIAGDDTAFLAMRDDDAAEELCRRMRKLI